MEKHDFLFEEKSLQHHTVRRDRILAHFRDILLCTSRTRKKRFNWLTMCACYVDSHISTKDLSSLLNSREIFTLDGNTHSHGIRQKFVARPSPRNKETENMPKWLLFIIVNVCKFGFLSILFFSISNNSTPYGRGLGVLTHLYELTN